MERLSADDRLLLTPDQRWPQDVGLVALLDGGQLVDRQGRFPVQVAVDALAGVIHRMPRLRQVLRVPRRGLGGPYWVDAPAFDLRDHVRVSPVAGPGGDADLLWAVELIRRRRLDTDRPLWELWILPGSSDGRVGLFFRMHHVMADGVAGIASLARLLSGPAPTAAEAAPWTPGPEPSHRELLLDNLRGRAGRLRSAASSIRHPATGLRAARSTLPAVRELFAGEPGPVTSLGGVVGPHRSLHLVRGRLAEVSAIGHANDATVNDVLLAMIAGGARSLLASRGEPVTGLVLPAYVPVSLRRAAGTPGQEPGQGNEISQMIVPLPVGPDDPLERLHAITESSRQRKARPRRPLGPVLRGPIVSALMLPFIVRQRINLLSADLIGPSQPLSFAGAPVLEAFPLINLLGNITLGVGALSYAGAFDVLVVGDADLHPDLDVFAAAAAAELHALSADSAERRRA